MTELRDKMVIGIVSALLEMIRLDELDRVELRHLLSRPSYRINARDQAERRLHWPAAEQKSDDAVGEISLALLPVLFRRE